VSRIEGLLDSLIKLERPLLLALDVDGTIAPIAPDPDLALIPAQTLLTLAALAKLPMLELEQLEKMAIEQALERSGWHQGRAADLLGVSARTLHRKLKTFGLRRPQ